MQIRSGPSDSFEWWILLSEILLSGAHCIVKWIRISAICQIYQAFFTVSTTQHVTLLGRCTVIHSDRCIRFHGTWSVYVGFCCLHKHGWRRTTNGCLPVWLTKICKQLLIVWSEKNEQNKNRKNKWKLMWVCCYERSMTSWVANMRFIVCLITINDPVNNPFMCQLFFIHQSTILHSWINNTSFMSQQSFLHESKIFISWVNNLSVMSQQSF